MNDGEKCCLFIMLVLCLLMVCVNNIRINQTYDNFVEGSNHIKAQVIQSLERTNDNIEDICADINIIEETIKVDVSNCPDYLLLEVKE